MSLKLEKYLSRVLWNPFDSKASLEGNSTSVKIAKVALTIFLTLATGFLFLAFPTTLWCINWINRKPLQFQKQRDSLPPPSIEDNSGSALQALRPSGVVIPLVDAVSIESSPLPETTTSKEQQPPITVEAGVSEASQPRRASSSSIRSKGSCNSESWETAREEEEDISVADPSGLIKPYSEQSISQESIKIWVTLHNGARLSLNCKAISQGGLTRSSIREKGSLGASQRRRASLPSRLPITDGDSREARQSPRDYSRFSATTRRSHLSSELKTPGRGPAAAGSTFTRAELGAGPGGAPDQSVPGSDLISTRPISAGASAATPTSSQVSPLELMARRHIQYLIDFLVEETLLPTVALASAETAVGRTAELPGEIGDFVLRLLRVIIEDRQTESAPINQTLASFSYIPKTMIDLFKEVLFWGEVNPIIQEGKELRGSIAASEATTDPVITLKNFGRGFLGRLDSMDSKFSQFLKLVPATTVDKLFTFPGGTTTRQHRTMLEFCRLPVAPKIFEFILQKMQVKVVRCLKDEGERAIARRDFNNVIAFCNQFHQLMVIMYNDECVEKTSFNASENQKLREIAEELGGFFSTAKARRTIVIVKGGKNQITVHQRDTISVIEKYVHDPLIKDLKKVVTKKMSSLKFLGRQGLLALSASKLKGDFEKFKKGDFVAYSTAKLQEWIDSQAASSEIVPLTEELEKELIGLGFNLLHYLSQNWLIQSILAILPRPLLQYGLGIRLDGPLTILGMLRSEGVFERIRDFQSLFKIILEKPEISSIFDHLAQHQKLIEFLIKRDYLTAHWGPSLLADFDKLSGEKKASIRTGLNALAGQLVGIRAKHFVKERGASPSF